MIIFLGARIRRSDVKLLFSNSNILFLPVLLDSAFLMHLYLFFLLVLYRASRLVNKNHHIEIWSSDFASIFFAKLRNYNTNILRINYFSWNIETDFPLNIRNDNSNKFLLFRSDSLANCPIAMGWKKYPLLNYDNYTAPSNAKKLKSILYFGELNIPDVSTISNPKIQDIIADYINNVDVNNSVLDADIKLIEMYKQRQAFNASEFAELCAAKNYQRLFYIKLIERRFPCNLNLIGDDFVRYGFRANKSIYKRKKIERLMNSATVVLDLGSKSFFEPIYPRSYWALKMKSNLVQLHQGGETRSFMNNFHIVTGDEIITKIEQLLS